MTVVVRRKKKRELLFCAWEIEHKNRFVTKLLLQRHPAVLVTAGFFFIYITQLVEGAWLYSFASGVSIFAVLFARQHLLKVLHRLKYVALAIVVLFAWQTPGIQAVPVLQSLSPTIDGFRLAVVPLLRLLSVAAVVASLKEGLKPDQWVNSLYVLAWPFAYFGLSRERLAIRLRLVLDYVEDEDLHWRSLIKNPIPVGKFEERVTCALTPISAVDLFLIVLIVVVAVGVSGW